jgi:hypothetical protein
MDQVGSFFEHSRGSNATNVNLGVVLTHNSEDTRINSEKAFVLQVKLKQRQLEQGVQNNLLNT